MVLSWIIFKETYHWFGSPVGIHFAIRLVEPQKDLQSCIGQVRDKMV